MNTQKLIKTTLYTFAVLTTIALLWVINFLILGNFHQVDKNVYRSAQLFSFNMPYYIQKYKFKSIINLRGESRQQWYKDEKEIAKKFNVTHFDYGIEDRDVQSLEKMKGLIEVIKNAPKPVLLHCKAGADRTSLAAALYKLAITNEPNPHKEISLKYGHFPWFGSRTVAIDESFENFLTHYLEKPL